MNIQQTIFKIFLVGFTSLILSSCNKSDELNVNRADFKVSSQSVYLNEAVYLEALDTLGAENYNWNFGDGISLKNRYKISHQYDKQGIYLTSLNINGLNYSKSIRVLSGKLSYQIVNNSSRFLDLFIYIDNYDTGCTKRFEVSYKSKSDTIYATSNGNIFGNKHIFGLSVFVENSEYRFPDVTWIYDFKHLTMIITDSTQLTPKVSHNIKPKVTMLKDLYQ